MSDETTITATCPLCRGTHEAEPVELAEGITGYVVRCPEAPPDTITAFPRPDARAQ